MVRMDLHVHSTVSDGELTPKEVVEEAIKQHVDVLAITDHDEIAAYEQTINLANDHSIQLIPGIELNTDGIDGELHILGYFFDPEHPKMKEHVLWRKNERKEWAKKIIHRLQELGYHITFENTMKHVKGEVIVRTHISEELTLNGYFASAKEAYETLLAKGKKAFINRAPFSAEDAIHLIHECGGEAYLAHPGAYKFSFNERNILSYGIDGIEVYHSKHTEEDVRYWKTFVSQHDLKISGGSDHHGLRSRNPYPIGSVQMDEEAKEYWLRSLPHIKERNAKV